ERIGSVDFYRGLVLLLLIPDPGGLLSLGRIWGHGAIRALTLICLGLALSSPIHSRLDEIWPLLILLAGCPIPSMLARLARVSEPNHIVRIEFSWWILLLALSLLRFVPRFHEYGIFESASLLVQLGLAALPAMLIVGRNLRLQGAVAAGVLLFYWLAFATYSPPHSGAAQVAPSVADADGLLPGFFAH
ncbi:MAG: hypothetical protein NZM12_13435, partial [Steroidobacteraceae bacterium]|nr:hypothetical protein [Steroidobacteraceae bacterium]